MRVQCGAVRVRARLFARVGAIIGQVWQDGPAPAAAAANVQLVCWYKLSERANNVVVVVSSFMFVLLIVVVVVVTDDNKRTA